MKSAFTKSRQLLFVAVILLVLILANGAFLWREVSRLQNDARIINYAGIMRGSIQRACNHELAGRRVDAVIGQVDALIASFENRDSGFEIKMFEERFFKELQELKAAWSLLKHQISAFRASHNDDSRQRVLVLAEQCWAASDRLVYTTQCASEAKLNVLEYVFILIILNAIAVLIIIDLVRSYVRQQLEFAAHHDQLTGALNRYSYTIALEREVKRSRRYGSPLSILLFDIDNFKAVNDTHGHKAGDSVLREVARIVSEQIRDSDFLCRVGGEEFVVIAVESDGKSGSAMAEKLRGLIQERNFKTTGRITVSFGVAELDADENSDSFFKRADAALYRAKQAGRNRVSCAGMKA
ncbi:MAG: GGDEF domain-containing protein [Spirochaetales bacterium]|nr:MAG: GGDEF domain-containing protein [Spirochaetales bacterium]